MTTIPFTIQTRTSVSVNVTGATVYSDQAGTQAVTMPATISSDTTWYIASTATLAVTVTENGSQWGPVSVPISGDVPVVIDYPARSIFDHDSPAAPVTTGGSGGGAQSLTGDVTGTLSGTAIPTTVVKLRGAAVPLTPEQYGAKGDVIHFTDANITAGTNVLTSTSQGTSSSGDIGKTVCVEGALASSAANPLGVLVTTITGVSGSGWTLTDNAAATVTGGNASFGTDDTDALNEFFAAAADKDGRLSSQYLITGTVSIPESCSVDGGFVRGLYRSLSVGKGVGVPCVYPYLKGSALLVAATGLSEAINITAEGLTLNLSNFGVRWMVPFASGSTNGHGINYVPGTNVNGLVSSLLENLWFFGNDGSSYGLNLSNVAFSTLMHIMQVGGGLLHEDMDASGWNYGNNLHIMCRGKLAVGGTAQGTYITKTSGNEFTSLAFIKHGANSDVLTTYGFTGVTPPTSSQRVFNCASDVLEGLSMVSPEFDDSNTSVSSPTLPGIPGIRGGVFLDPGGFFNYGGETFGGGPQSLPPNAGSFQPGFGRNVTKTSSFTISDSAPYYSNCFICNAASGAIVATLPDLSAVGQGWTIDIFKGDTSANAVTIAPQGTNTIIGKTSLTTAGEKVTVTTDGNKFYIG